MIRSVRGGTVLCLRDAGESTKMRNKMQKQERNERQKSLSLSLLQMVSDLTDRPSKAEVIIIPGLRDPRSTRRAFIYSPILIYMLRRMLRVASYLEVSQSLQRSLLFQS